MTAEEIARLDVVRLDTEDPLRVTRALFALGDDLIYLDGNSLGPPTVATLERLATCARKEWAQGLIGSWNEAGWIDLPKKAGAKIARIIGADPDDVIVCDSVSVNLFKLAAALGAAMPGAPLVVDRDEFPTDAYIADALARLAGAPRLEAKPLSGPFIEIRSLVHYRTAEICDMRAAEAQARAQEGAIIWDLSHAAGAIDVALATNGARFAVGCGYKFLNGGPGAPAYVYVARHEAERLRQPIEGWMGHAAPFDFGSRYAPADGVRRFAAGTPPILSLAALDAALDAFDGIDMRQAEKKARALGDLFLARTADLNLASATPAGARRGAHVALCFERGYEVVQALIARGILGDFRPPDVMRFGFAPLYVSYADARAAADALVEIVTRKGYLDPAFVRRKRVP